MRRVPEASMSDDELPEPWYDHEPADLAGRMVHRLFHDLNDRRGFRQAWDGCGDDVRAEIWRSWLDIAAAALDESDASTPQPPPTGDGAPVLPELLEHIRNTYGPIPSDGVVALCYELLEHAEAGEKKYGTPLRAHNGRDAVADAYQEALDLCMYLAQARLEGRDCHDLLRDALRLALDMVEYRKFGG